MSIVYQNMYFSNLKPQKRDRNNSETISTNNTDSISYNQHINSIGQIKSKKQKRRHILGMNKYLIFVSLTEDSKKLYNSYRKILTTYQENDITINSIISLEPSLNNFISNSHCFNCVSDILSNMMKWDNCEENEKYYTIILE